MGLKDNNNYSAESIITLEGLTPFRQSPGMYIGATDANGVFHIVKEIVNNSVDEALNSICRNIKITLLKDGGIRIEDDGRGFPHGMQDETFSILGACFGKEHTGGKFMNDGASGYNSSGGMHGIGCKCAAALGIKTLAVSHRDGIEETVEFTQGKLVRQITNGKCDKKLHGTLVEWYPDVEIFTQHSAFDKERIERELCQEYSFLNSGVRFILREEATGYEKEYYSENGIKDYLDFLNKDKEYILNPIYLSAEEGDYSVEVGIAYNTSYSPTIKLYTNSVPQVKGTHLTGFKTAWTSAINKFARENGWLKDKDENLTGDDLAEGQLLIINFKMINPIFEGQIKENLTSTEGRTYTHKLISSCIEDYLIGSRNEIKEVINKGLLARKARKAAQKARESARGANKKKEQPLKLPSKLADCNSSDRTKCEIFIVEGDSAGGNAKAARNMEYQAILPLRGKVLNTCKASMDKIQKNAEIMTMADAFGLKTDLKTMKFTYDEKDLRYDKIIIMADADIDGNHIVNLILTFIWTYCPKLIEQGHVYISIPPLYRITEGKDSFIYLKDDEELKQYQESHKGKKYIVNRFKGLGEMDEDETNSALLNPETRKIKQIVLTDIPETTKIFNQFMGESTIARRNFVLAKAEEKRRAKLNEKSEH